MLISPILMVKLAYEVEMKRGFGRPGRQHEVVEHVHETDGEQKRYVLVFVRRRVLEQRVEQAHAECEGDGHADESGTRTGRDRST